MLGLIQELNADDGDRRPSSFAAAPPSDRPGPDPGGRADQGRGRVQPVQRRSAVPRGARALPGTPLGDPSALDEYGVKFEARPSSGRSEIVGKPVALLLLQGERDRTICHSRTRDLSAETVEAGVLVAAVGVPDRRPGHGRGQRNGVDVGLTDGRRVVGDVHRTRPHERASDAGPGGVGPMTIAMLLRGTLRAALYRRRLLALPVGVTLCLARCIKFGGSVPGPSLLCKEEHSWFRRV